MRASARILIFAALLLAAGRQEPAPKKLTFVTYNVLAEEVDPARIAPLLKLIEDSDADVIALQEVLPWFLAKLSKEKWASRYRIARVGPDPTSANGQCLLSRLSVEKASSHRLPGREGRDVLVATLTDGDVRWTVATTHMESRLDEGATRAKQLDRIFQLLKDKGNAVFLGDLNFGEDEKPETSHLDKDFTDAWKALKPEEPGYTWDIGKSSWADHDKLPGEKSRRIDRILFRAAGWKAGEIRILGDTPVPPSRKDLKHDLFPSDHFGLRAVIEKKD